MTGKEKKFDVGEYLDQSSEIQAAFDFFGPKDLAILADYPEYDRFGDAARPVEGLLGVAPKLCKELGEKASPIHYVHKDSAPILILHGTKDELVPIEQSIDFDPVSADMLFVQLPVLCDDVYLRFLCNGHRQSDFRHVQFAVGIRHYATFSRLASRRDFRMGIYGNLYRTSFIANFPGSHWCGILSLLYM